MLFRSKDYINVNNQKLSLTSRKKIALQFLYGVNYLYKKKYFHRDLSWNNVLIKQYDCGVVFVKISDFEIGLYKYAAASGAKILKQIAEKKDLDEKLEREMKGLIEDYKNNLDYLIKE